MGSKWNKIEGKHTLVAEIVPGELQERVLAGVLRPLGTIFVIFWVPSGIPKSIRSPILRKTEVQKQLY